MKSTCLLSQYQLQCDFSVPDLKEKIAPERKLKRYIGRSYPELTIPQISASNSSGVLRNRQNKNLKIAGAAVAVVAAAAWS